MATLTAICVGGRVSALRRETFTPSEEMTPAGDDSNDPLSKESSQRLTVRAPTVFAPETTQPRETWVQLWRGSPRSLSELGRGGRETEESSVAQSLHEIGPRSPGAMVRDLAIVRAFQSGTRGSFSREPVLAAQGDPGCLCVCMCW